MATERVSAIKETEVKQASFTGTTSGTGLLLPTNYLISQMTILGLAQASGNQSYMVIPFVGNNKYWYFKVVNNGNFGNVANTQLTITFWYLER